MLKQGSSKPAFPGHNPTMSFERESDIQLFIARQKGVLVIPLFQRMRWTSAPCWRVRQSFPLLPVGAARDKLLQCWRLQKASSRQDFKHRQLSSICVQARWVLQHKRNGNKCFLLFAVKRQYLLLNSPFEPQYFFTGWFEKRWAPLPQLWQYRYPRRLSKDRSKFEFKNLPIPWD